MMIIWIYQENNFIIGFVKNKELKIELLQIMIYQKKQKSYKKAIKILIF